MESGNSSDFEGRVALVTGGASGIGAAAVQRLRAGGAAVAVFDLMEPDVDVEAAIVGDVTRSIDLDGAVARIESELGRLDILVCCAGVSGDSLRTVDVSDAEWAGGQSHDSVRADHPGRHHAADHRRLSF